MMDNLFLYIKRPKFIIVTALYILGIITLQMGYFSIYYNQEIDVNYFVFSYNLAIFMIQDLITKRMVLFTIIILSVPQFLYIIFLGITYYHHSYEMDSCFLFLRISRKKKLLNYYQEITILFSLVYTVLTFYQILILYCNFNIKLIWSLIIINLINSLVFYLFIIILMIFMQVLFTDWTSSVITLFMLIILSYGNYFYYYPDILLSKTDLKITDNIIQSKILNYIPTHMNIIYHHNLVYSLIYLIFISLLILFSLSLVIKKDYQKEVVK